MFKVRRRSGGWCGVHDDTALSLTVEGPPGAVAALGRALKGEPEPAGATHRAWVGVEAYGSHVPGGLRKFWPPHFAPPPAAEPGRPTLFLDLDGVGNGHEKVSAAADCCGLNLSSVLELNRVVHATGCQVVVASAWRYMLTRGQMTLGGFWYMLRTHGFTANGDANPVVGWTREDRAPGESRAAQCGEWAAAAGLSGRYAAVDDMDLGYTAAAFPVVLTDGKVGLTAARADALIALLK